MYAVVLCYDNTNISVCTCVFNINFIEVIGKK